MYRLLGGGQESIMLTLYHVIVILIHRMNVDSRLCAAVSASLCQCPGLPGRHYLSLTPCTAICQTFSLENVTAQQSSPMTTLEITLFEGDRPHYMISIIGYNVVVHHPPFTFRGKIVVCHIDHA